MDASVTSTISQITSSYGDRVKVERSAQAGDEVVVDYEGTYNGERFTGSTAGDSKIVIGAGYFVSGFEDQLIGHFAGEVFDITVTYRTSTLPPLTSKAMRLRWPVRMLFSASP